MRRGDPLPLIWLAAGAVSDPRGLARFGGLEQVLVPVGPVIAGPEYPEAAGHSGHTGRSQPADQVPAGLVHELGPGGLDHAPARGIALLEAIERLRWCDNRGLSALVSVRGTSATGMSSVVGRLCRSLEADAVGAVEVDLRGADDQSTLKAMARLREETPRDLLLLARLSALQPDLVAAARGAVAGGAGAIVVCGSVRLGPHRWWSGPSTAAVSRAGLRTLARAGEEHRWPAVPLIGAGGVCDVGSAVGHLRAGASAVQLGTALWADPTLLHRLRTDLHRDHDLHHHPFQDQE